SRERRLVVCMHHSGDDHPGDHRKKRCDDERDAAHVLHSTTSSTGMLPRVAFEYGQIWCAASISACCCSRDKPGTWIFRRACSAKPPPSLLPISTSQLTFAFEASTFCCAAANNTAPLKQVA